MPSARVLFAASEVYPFAKTGGLADVGYGLPKALRSLFDVKVIMPLYRFIDKKRYGIKSLSEGFDVVIGGTRHAVTLYGCRFEGGDYLFVSSPLLCDREYLYGPPDKGYTDNALRFGLFSNAIAHIAKQYRADIVHLNDWQTALAALSIAEDDENSAKTVYTIHNLAYQGVFEKTALTQLGIGKAHFTIEGLEYYGKLNLMKAGIGYADAVTTVSPTYAQEILTPEFGCGLEGYLQAYRSKLSGIANGIDTDHFSPDTDRSLVRPYKTPRGKGLNKKRYLEAIGLCDAEKPLFIFIGRFTWQKGMDLLIDALPKMAAYPCNIAILGEGETSYHRRLEAAAEGLRNVHLRFGYDEALSHRMYAAADFLLMPSLFEPCGLNQLIAMHYGAMPIVHRVGGLADTVHPISDGEHAAEYGYGLCFEPATQSALMRAFAEAMSVYADTPRFSKMAAYNMKADVSWRHSAGVYADLYRKISNGWVE